MIQAIIFDFGNVICRFDNTIFVQNISKITGKSAMELHEMIYTSSDVTRRYETGLISSEEFLDEISRMCALSISKADFIQSFTGIFTPNTEIMELIRKIKGSYKIGLLSNTNEWHFEYIIRLCAVYDLFDSVTLSYRVKAMKPDVRIYEDALNKLNAKADECVYIDDIEKYIQAANVIGMQGIHYQSHQVLIHTLNKLDIYT